MLTPSRRPGLLVALMTLVTLLFALTARADVSLPAILSTNMVLQRDMPVPFWGWANPGEKVTVTLADQSVSATADDKGNWSLKLAALKAGGPIEVTVAGGGANKITLANVMVGEVWLCSGQSNMVLPTGATRNAKEETADAKTLPLRFFTVDNKTTREVQKDVKGKWVLCDSNSANGFSAVGFYFGRFLALDQKVPVGMINASVNGSGISGWMPPEAWQIDVRTQAEYAKSLTDKGPVSMWTPAALYNGMIAPLAPYALRGLLWYQGESNAGGDKLYRFHFEGMVSAWRKAWNEGDFPVLYVQLPSYSGAANKFWIDFQEIQTQCLSIPNTGMAVINDNDEPNNLHPGNKLEVAHRLWLNAAAKVYGHKDVEFSGPVLDKMKVEGHKAILTFTHLGGGLVAKGSEDGKTVKGFIIAGADGKFAPANAVIEGDTVIVSADGIDQPTAVRYAWELVPKCNLYNKANLPPGPFRTDSSGPSIMALSRPNLKAIDLPYAKNPLTVDGDGADWKDISAMPLPFMKKDAGSVKLAWREEGLYGLLTVTEDKITVNAKTPWAGDCFELFLEKDAAGAGDRTPATAQYIFAPDPKGEPGKAFTMVAFGSEKAAKLEAQWKKTDTGYSLEFFIPADVLKPAIMAADTKLGCNFTLSQAGKPVEQFFADKNTNDSWGVPATWGLLKLAKP
jgi:sialate O-acetylesterase